MKEHTKVKANPKQLARDSQTPLIPLSQLGRHARFRFPGSRKVFRLRDHYATVVEKSYCKEKGYIFSYHKGTYAYNSNGSLVTFLRSLRVIEVV